MIAVFVVYSVPGMLIGHWACPGGCLLDSAISLTDGARHPGVR